MSSISMSVSYRDEEELYRAVANQLEGILGHGVEVKAKTLRADEFEDKIKTGWYDGHAYTVDQLSEKWNCSENYIRDEIKRGRLTAYKAGKRYYITPSNVRKYEGELL